MFKGVLYNTHISYICIAICGLLSLKLSAAAPEPSISKDSRIALPDDIEVIEVRHDSLLSEKMGDVGSQTMLSGEELSNIGATHINETLNRVPGIWLSRGSGQEHLTAIRSAVLTGPGACGGFLFLEDSVPIRPVGFCNVNNLFEVNSEQASAIEVWRGPASAVLGGNALLGAVNVLTAIPDSNTVSLEGGSYDYYQAGLTFNSESDDERFTAAFLSSSTNGYRDDTGYDQQKVSLTYSTQVGNWQVFNTLNGTHLNQDTGGYVYGYKAYKDNQLRKSNPNPEAYRKAWSMRFASHWAHNNWRIVPYIRSSSMKFLQHFIPGQPREHNEQTSAGVISESVFQPNTETLIKVGAQTEAMHAHVDEFQNEELKDSSPFNNNVRNQGTHYDFDVNSFMMATYYDLRYDITKATRLVNSLRVEFLEYDYDNKGLDGNTRDDGSTCNFGGCLYYRPADRDDIFHNIAGRLGLEHDFQWARSYVVIGSGFRPPQVNELYRLQRNQQVADLDSEQVLSTEVGLKQDAWEISLFTQETDNIIFRDAAGLNVSDGKTRSKGVEFAAQQSWDKHTFSLSGTYAVHKYDFNRNVSGGEIIKKGNDVDTAPRWLGNALWHYQVTPTLSTELELVYQDDYFVNAENTAKYEGHTVFNLRGHYQITNSVKLYGRFINLFDKEYADRADWTLFNDERYRYFPAMPRQLYLGFTADF